MAYEELAALARELREARQRDESVHHIRVTPMVPLGTVLELPLTEERARLYGAGPRQREIIMHPEDWANFLKTPQAYLHTEMQYPVSYALGLPVYHD